MRFPSWLLPALVIALVVAAGAWLTEGDDTNPDIAQAPPASAPMPSSIAARGQEQTPPHGLLWTPAKSTKTLAASSAMPLPAHTSAPQSPLSPSPPRLAEGMYVPASSMGRTADAREMTAPSPVDPEPSITPLPRLESTLSGTGRNRPQRPPFDQRAVTEARRYLRRERPPNRPDRFDGPPPFVPPWFSAYDYNLERYRDARESSLRQKRRFYRRRDKGWMGDICPWTKPERSWSARPGNPWAMEQPTRAGEFQQFLRR